MNSDMYPNSDWLYTQLLNWLVAKSAYTSSPLPRQEGQPQDMSDRTQEYFTPRDESTVKFNGNGFDPLDGEELEFTNSTVEDPIPFQSLDMGDIPVVQNRFQALLKRRIQAEIAINPPLFPWETEISDYEPEYADELVHRTIPSPWSWIPQLANFQFLIPMPEQVLNQLLEACSQVMAQSRPQPAKMVEAVSNLFPNQHQLLNDLALAFPGNYRAGATTIPAHKLPQAYETATSQQQMVLSLLAAREIIENLTLTLSPRENFLERQWETEVGVVALQAEYQAGQTVKLKVKLPKGGKVRLETPQASSQAQRTYPGYVSVELFDCQPGQTYPVEISLADTEQKPLTFALVISN